MIPVLTPEFVLGISVTACVACLTILYGSLDMAPHVCGGLALLLHDVLAKLVGTRNLLVNWKAKAGGLKPCRKYL